MFVKYTRMKLQLWVILRYLENSPNIWQLPFSIIYGPQEAMDVGLFTAERECSRWHTEGTHWYAVEWMKEKTFPVIFTY